MVLDVHTGVTTLQLCSLTLEGCFCGHVKVPECRRSLRIWRFGENHAQTIYDPNIFR